VSVEAPLPPRFGGRGDPVAARRRRRSFLCASVSVVLITASLYISDCYGRYGRMEYLLRGSLRLEDANSSRTFLRNAVRGKPEGGDLQLSRYLQALAEREEPGEIIPTWERAYQVDRANPALAIRYGVALFLAGKAKEARDLFHEAALNDQSNALPAYLEATMIPFMNDSKGDISEALALIARTNNGGKQVSFPKPIWTATFPASGKVYADLRRRAIDESLAPIYEFLNRVIVTAKDEIGRQQTQPWRYRVQTLDEMGKRLMRSSDQGSLQTICGIRVQLSAIDLQKLMNAQELVPIDEALVARSMKLQGALDKLNTFESTRGDRIEREMSKYGMFAGLWLWTFFAAISLWLLVRIVYAVLQPNEFFWTLQMPRAGLYIELGAAALMTIAICSITALLRSMSPSSPAIAYFSLSWWTLAALASLFCLVYSFVVFPRPGESPALPSEIHEGEKMVAAVTWRMYFEAVITLVRRYTGVWVALMMSCFCLWFLFHRLSLGLFPFYGQTLLVPGLTEEEIRTVVEALSELK
jgi:hypothetical protein